MIAEFKAFIMKGNLVEVAVGLIIALQLSDVVKSLTDNIINPIIGAIFGKPDFSSLVINAGDAEIRYGSFINSLISFAIIGFVLFLIVKGYNKMVEMSRRGGEAAEEDSAEVALLREIRDSLQARS